LINHFSCLTLDRFRNIGESGLCPAAIAWPAMVWRFPGRSPDFRLDGALNVTV
jgi:hypothetical protein